MFTITAASLCEAHRGDSGLRAVAQSGYESQGPTYLPVGHADEALVDQLVGLGVPRLALHDVALRRLVGQ